MAKTKKTSKVAKKATKKAIKAAPSRSKKSTIKRELLKVERKVERKLKSPETKKKIQEFEYDFGKITFVFGIMLSIIVGLALGTMSSIKMTAGIGLIYSIIFVLGIIVGVLNITVKEVNEFLIASITFLVAAGLNLYVINITLPKFGAVIQQIYFALGVFVAPAATIVALKAMYELARNR